MNVFELIKKSKRMVVFTGAGMSTESGLPDFRSNGGLWDGKKPEEISHVKMLNQDPKSIIDFYRQRAREALAHKPNRGHQILAEWDTQGIISAIVTQNIDGYHQRAGAHNVIELHGNLNFRSWMGNQPYTAEEFLAMTEGDYWKTNFDDFDDIIRPNVVLFGEDLPQLEWRRAMQRHAEADLCLVLGSSLAVYPANSLPEHTVALGGKLVIVTKSETPLDRMSVCKIDNMTTTEFLEAANDAIQRMD